MPPIFSGQIGTREIRGQFMAIAARGRSGHEQSVRDSELGDGKGFLPRINPLDTSAKAPGSFRHTQRFHGHNVAHASFGGQTPICTHDTITNPFRYGAACDRNVRRCRACESDQSLGVECLAPAPSAPEQKTRPGHGATQPGHRQRRPELHYGCRHFCSTSPGFKAKNQAEPPVPPSQWDLPA